MIVNYGTGFAVKPRASMRQRVDQLEAAGMNFPQVDCPVRHYFAPGLFAREMSIPAGTCVTGAVHRTENLVCVSMGRLQIVTEDGTREVVAGETLTCKAGMKNAVYTLEDSRWTNFFANPTNETNIDKLIEMLSFSTASELLGGADNKQLAANRAAEIQGA